MLGSGLSPSRRRLLQCCGTLGLTGFAGCVTDTVLSPDTANQGEDGGSTTPALSGDPASFTWKSFTYSSLDSVIANHGWNDQQTVRLIETPNVDDILDTDPKEVPEFTDYVNGTNFDNEFLIAIELAFPQPTYTFAVREVLWGDGDEIIVNGLRSRPDSEPEGATVVCLIRVSSADRAVPPVARVAYEREQPRDDEETWDEFKNYPDDGMTAISLLMENDDGEYVMRGYPSTLEHGEPHQFIIMVKNQESATVEYTVLTQLQRVDTDGGEQSVEERAELDRFKTVVGLNEQQPHKRNITPTMIGERLRLGFLLYKGNAPAEPTFDNAYRTLQLWVEVTE